MVIRKLAIYSFAGIILSLNLAINANTSNKNFFVNRNGFTKNKNLNEKKIKPQVIFLAENQYQSNKIDIDDSKPIANPNLINIKGPKISIILNKTPAKKAF